MMHAGNRPRGNRMVTRGHWGVRCWRAVGPAALLLSLVMPQVGPARVINAQAAGPAVVRPELSTYAGAPAAGTPTEVAQQPFGLAVLDRYTFVADPTNHVVRLLIDNTEVAFAGLGSLAVDGDGGDPAAAQLAGPYAVAIGQVTKVGYQVTGFDVYIADTFAHQIRKATVTIPTIDKPRVSLTAVISTIAGSGSFGFSGDRGAATSAQLNSPYGLAWDQTRNVLSIADTLNNRVRERSDNAIRTIAGTGKAGRLGDRGPAIGAQLSSPTGVAVRPDGDVVIADTGNNLVRVLQAAKAPGVAPTIDVEAGNGTASFAGDGKPPTQAQFAGPAAVLP